VVAYDMNSSNEWSHTCTFISTQMHDINTWMHLGANYTFIIHLFFFFRWPLQLSPTTFLLFNVFSLSFSLVTSLTFNWLFHHFFFIIIITFFTLLTFYIIFIYFKFFTFLKLTFGHPPLNCCITFKNMLNCPMAFYSVYIWSYHIFFFWIE